MMLTPCAVSTFASLPTALSNWSMNSDRWAGKYQLDFIDLLIVDEAGQVAPAIAGGAFALAKTALVIGDTRQIEPIPLVPRTVDEGNLKRCGLLRRNEDFQALEESGLIGSTSSLMRVAQQACRVSPYPELERGLYLFEHRRCYDEIINFSNTLCYKGKLRPLRGPAPADAILPPLGYLHVDGRATASGGSRVNRLEAQTIAAWLAAERDRLERRYHEKLERIVGIVTPFSRQASEIRKACAEKNIAIDKKEGVTIGTVHALQGAERPIVILSPVYSKHADGAFIDASTSMLNVTVSRARDSCLVFGDMHVISRAPPGSPRAVLGDFLFRSADNALEFGPLPRQDLQEDGAAPRVLKHAPEHDAFLLDALAGEGRRYTIASPWVILKTMETAGLLSAFEAAVGRGAEIEVLADHDFNAPSAKRAAGLSPEREALAEIGVRLRVLRRLHSKVVIVDENVMALGSFNWLSARRQRDFARHEASYVYSGRNLAAEIREMRESLREIEE